MAKAIGLRSKYRPTGQPAALQIISFMKASALAWANRPGRSLATATRKVIRIKGIAISPSKVRLLVEKVGVF